MKSDLFPAPSPRAQESSIFQITAKAFREHPNVLPAAPHLLQYSFYTSCSPLSQTAGFPVEKLQVWFFLFKATLSPSPTLPSRLPPILHPTLPHKSSINAPGPRPTPVQQETLSLGTPRSAGHDVGHDHVPTAAAAASPGAARSPRLSSGTSTVTAANRSSFLPSFLFKNFISK